MGDVADALAPKSDQQNFTDYITGPRTVTITGAKVLPKGSEQPIILDLAEYPGRPYKPNKSMGRVMAKWWGGSSQMWVGRRLTLFGNPAVMWGGKERGGIEISHMSHIDGPKTMPLVVRRGQWRDFTVYPLPTQAPAALNIPQEVIDTTTGITDPAELTSYAQYLTTQGAPAHVTDWVLAQRKES